MVNNPPTTSTPESVQVTVSAVTITPRASISPTPTITPLSFPTAIGDGSPVSTLPTRDSFMDTATALVQQATQRSATQAAATLGIGISSNTTQEVVGITETRNAIATEIIATLTAASQ